MSKEYIERGALLKALNENCCSWAHYVDAIFVAEKVPAAADVVEVKHGRWIIPTKIGCRAFDIPHCSVCDSVPCGVDSNTNYCPNCGSKMDGGAEDG